MNYFKKIIAGILVLSFALLFSSCGKKIDIVEGHDFSDDVAWVSAKGDLAKIHCINKKGKILFSISLVQYLGNFKNGICTVDNSKIINKKGDEIITPEKQNYDKLENVFYDSGLILVSKNVETYEHSAINYGVFDSTGKVVLKMSENSFFKGYSNTNDEFKYLDNGYLQRSYKQYSDNDTFMLYGNRVNEICNLSTGEIINTDEIVSKVNKKFVKCEDMKDPFAYSYYTSVITPINKQGNCVIKATIDYAYEEDEVAYFNFNIKTKKAVEISLELEYGYKTTDSRIVSENNIYDFNGKLISKLDYNKFEIISIENDKMLIGTSNDGGSKYITVIDLITGKSLFEPILVDTYPTEMSSECIILRDKKIVIDINGKTLFDLKDLDGKNITAFSNDVSYVSNTVVKEFNAYSGYSDNSLDGGCYYIDKNGKRLF